MTNKNEAIFKIEELIGSEGTFQIASEMLDIMQDDGFVTFSPSEGYLIQPKIDEYKFSAMLQRAEERLV